MPEKLRLIVDPAQDGADNMSLDEALLHSAATGKSPDTLRFYQWTQPTLSLGYFQAEQDRLAHAASRSCSAVRRSSGGGAILHHHELTYSLVVKASDRFASAELYELVHASLIEFLAQQGIESERFRSPVENSKVQPFLCFQRRAPGDVISKGSKICGSAQRRVGDCVLQHGSLLLAQSPFAPELPGIADLWGVSLDAAAIRTGWLDQLNPRLAREFCDGSWLESELESARKWRKERFGNSHWLDRR